MTPFTGDELELIEAEQAGAVPPPPYPDGPAGDELSDVAETSAAAAGETSQGFPLAEGVTEARATGYALFDGLLGRYLEQSYRKRPPTKKMLKAHKGAHPRFVWHRV